ncbi:MAG: MFS transporter [Chloroflexota bacterium]|nr:MFS transporter [Chloroflexota bacterium]
MVHATSADVSTPAIPRIGAHQWLTLAIVLGGTFMAVFDLFVVNVAIPTIQRDLHANFAQIQFVLAGYALAYAVLLVTGGRLGDVYGRKRLFMLGMAGFTLASALCGFAPVPTLLVTARIVQGLAAAAMTPQVLSTIQVTFAPQERGRAFGVYGAVTGIAGSSGQALGGLLIRADLFGLSWRPVFLVNLPIGVAVLIAAACFLTESRSATAPRLDLGGVGILSAGLFLLIFPLVEGRDAGWPAWAWLCLAASVPVLVAFVLFERRKTVRDGSPLVVLRLFHARAFVAGLLVTLPNNAAGAASFFLLALYLQLGLHFSALAAGLIFAPGALAFFLAATVSVKLTPKLGSRMIAVGLAILIAAGVLGSIVVHRTGEAPAPLLLALVSVIQGIGAGSASPPLIGAILAGIDRDDAGAASGVLATTQQIGSALGWRSSAWSSSACLQDMRRASAATWRRISSDNSRGRRATRNERRPSRISVPAPTTARAATIPPSPRPVASDHRCTGRTRSSLRQSRPSCNARMRATTRMRT